MLSIASVDELVFSMVRSRANIAIFNAPMQSFVKYGFWPNGGLAVPATKRKAAMMNSALQSWHSIAKNLAITMIERAVAEVVNPLTCTQ